MAHATCNEPLVGEKVKLLFLEPKYRKYRLMNQNDCQVNHSFDFSKDKLFHEDEIEIFQNHTFTLIHSPVRKQQHISGILVLANNKTYGKYKDKFIYKCIPDNKYLPPFLVPYNKKNSFNKNFVNLYVTFKFESWNDLHPRGLLNQVIGPVTELSAFYEYQLYCKSLNASIQRFNRDTSQKLKNKTEKEFIEQIVKKHKNIRDFTSRRSIFTIDSKSCCDYDDALEYEENSDGFVIRIHIANVLLWMDILDLWDSFSDRISTIYLPDRKRPMLPTCLSECLCSLVENQKRFVFTFEINISFDFKIKNVEFYNSLVTIYKNHIYESKELFADNNYTKLFNIAQEMNKDTNYKMLSTIKSSYDLVTYFMIFMNFNISTKLIECDDGIFRTAFMNKDIKLPNNLDDVTKNFITAWNSQAGEYVLGCQKAKHEWLNLDTYCHITSPIRRLVDLLNSIIFQKHFGLVILTEGATKFVNKWKNKLDYVNVCMKYIRKVQTECSLLSLFHEHQKKTNEPQIIEGVIFNQCKREDGLYIYNVYLPSVKLLSRIKLSYKIDNYSNASFRLFYFKDENTLKQKIRLQIL